MLKSSNDGIICDLCKSDKTGDFLYYSTNLNIIIIKHNIVSTTTKSNSTDLCENCISNIQTRLVNNYIPTKIINNHYPKGLNCELDKNHVLYDNFSYMKIIFDKVQVFNHKTFCNNCQKDKNNCSCKDQKLITAPTVKVDHNVLEINCCTQCYKDYINDQFSEP